MSVATLRERVLPLVGKPTTPALLCITGASGAGKTTALGALRAVLEAVSYTHLTLPTILRV